MKIFEFSNKAIEKIRNELEKAEKYIRIAVFQLHREEIFQILKLKLNEGVDVEIFTLPYDSIFKDVEKIKDNFKELEKLGAILHFCKWNLGDPERTSTAVGQWYSFHGKFIVTDKSAIAMSANFTKKNEIDAVLILEKEGKMEIEFNKKFDELLDLFIIKNAGYDGSIRKKIISNADEKIIEIFNLPKNISNKYLNHWILHYPMNLCPDDVHIKNGLFITPLDGRGRKFYEEIISKAEKFMYISTESFTDLDFSKFLKKMSLKQLDMKILAGAESMDFRDRIQKMFRELLAHQIEIKTSNGELHAKMLITDKHLVLSSINLNKMNLGFKSKAGFWREDTETIFICDDEKIINIAQNQFKEVFNKSIEIEEKLEKGLKRDLGKMFTSTFNLSSTEQVKSTFAKIVLNKEIQMKKFVLELGKIVRSLMTLLNKKQVNFDYFLASLIYYYILKKDKVSYSEIGGLMNNYGIMSNIDNSLDILIKFSLIGKNGDYYSPLKKQKSSDELI